ncbi:Rgg family transcriptional regulator [Streptococcus thermophilus]|nr:Rgg/GadR/MutR family transcriptional regulator [Streptococcus thermophilus]MCE2066279.1 Rgg/GadR/MutR family transcriptional regulator [Streptococcus thermophilus]MCE2084510.1 Rgg/GadR/MutR family transcriptional regulator [Streptococcus thermophilus]
MNFGQTVEFIRHKKNFSIKQICGDYLSRQTYYRFVKDEIDISAKKLFYILDSLNVNVDEFLFINNNFQVSKEFSDMEKVKFHFENKDIKELNNLLTNYSSKSSSKEQVLSSLISSLIGRLTGEKAPNEEKLLREYLINIETWTHYETVLFNNSMFIFDNEFIELVFAKINYNIEKYSTLRYYGNESIRMFINMVILYIDRQDLIRAQQTLDTLQTFKLNDDCLYEKSCILFFSEVLNYLTRKTSTLNNCFSVITYFKMVGSTSIASMFELYLENIVKNYPYQT